MRPKSILHFEKLLLGSTALVVLNILFHYASLRTFALSHGSSPAGPFLGLVLALIFNLLFWFFIVRRASTVAKWIFVILIVLGLIDFATNRQVRELGQSYFLWSAFNTALQVAAAVMLFRRDAVDWLKSKGRPLDPRVFD